MQPLSAPRTLRLGFSYRIMRAMTGLAGQGGILADRDRTRTEFARLLRQFRQESELTQQELWERTGVSVREISKLENLTKSVKVGQAVASALADGLGL